MLDSLPNDGPASAPSGRRRRPGALVFRLYTSNPFYVISADLVFVGLRMSFDTHGKTFETWALMIGLAAYTVLLAATACLLIRRYEVWDDARSLLLLVVMMFLAMSVTFDNTLAGNPRLGTICFLGGLLFAVAVSEGLLRGIRLVLPFWFRMPYYLLLALFFLYPVGLIPLLNSPDSPALQWALFSFPTLAGFLFLTLLPAIRRGAGYVERNGSPWPWPLYPWVLFGLLAMAVCARASYLCVSLHFVQWTTHEPTNSIFAPYFLVPFLFALNLLVLEAGLVARRRLVLRTALAAPVGIVVLAMLGHRDDSIYLRFLTMFTDQLGGSPLYLAAIGATAFYAFAAYRAVPLASGALVTMLAALSVVGPGTLDLSGLRAPSPWPILAIGLLEAGLAYRRRASWHGLVAATAFVMTIGLGLPEELPVDRVLVVIQLAIVAILTLGAVFHDRLGRLLQHVGAGVLLLASVASILGIPRLYFEAPQGLLDRYALVSAVVAVCYGIGVRNRLYLATGGAILSVGLATVGWRSYLLLRQHFAGLDLITLGLVSFFLAALISLRKADALPGGIAGKRPQNEL